MPLCKYCQKSFSWGMAGEKWVPLIPVGQDDGYDRNYQDENGILRAAHKAVCVPYESAVSVTKLAQPVLASMVLPTQSRVMEEALKPKRKYNKKVKGNV